MIVPPAPSNEVQRLAVLRELNLLDTAAESTFDDITIAAAAMCGTPIALVSIVDDCRQWFKSHYGLDATETPRELAFCAHAILQPTELLMVPDARLDERFIGNPLVDGEPHVNFYAGMPICDRSSGLPLGTLCVIDHELKSLTARQQDGLRALARQVESVIDARKRLQQAAHDRLRLEATLASTPDGIYITDADGNCQYVNAAWCRMAGMSLARARGMGWLEAIHPDDRAIVTERWQRSCHDRQVFNSEQRFLRSDGSVVWTSAHAGEIRDDDLLHGYVGIVEDITVRRRTERALRESEGRLLEAQALARLGHFTFDITTGEVTWSSQLYAIFGMEPSGIAPSYERYLRLIHPDDRDALATKVAKSIEDGSSWELEYRIFRTDGSVGWVHGRAIVRPGPDGAPMALRGTVQDITDIVQTRQQLAAARDIAETAARAKSDFLATMSHEIRTPLNGVIGMTDLLMQTALNDEQRDYVETAQSSGKVLMSLVNDVLDFSKLEAGKVELEALSFSPRTLLEDTAAILAELAQAKGVELVVDIARSVPDCLIGDVSRLKQVVLNLLGNAVKFTERGEVIASLSGVLAGDAKFRLRLEIRDTGVGIPADRIKFLFEAFAQADSSTTRRFGGTGLGLAICRRLLGLMHGDIDVLSTPSIGSAFTVQLALPIGKNAETNNVFNIPTETRIVLVEEHRAVRAAVVSLCESVGLHVDLVTNIRDLAEVIHDDQPPEIIIVSGLASGMVGFSAMQELRRKCGEALPPVVLLSNVAQRSSLPTGMFAGVALRPVRRASLLGALAGALRGREPTVIRPAVAVVTASTRQPKVLVAEDNPVNQMVVASLLRKMNCQVDVVADGRKAVESSEAVDYDIIFMDCLMPLLDGYAATKAIRQRETGVTRVPIIALTANALEGDRDRCLNAGMDDYLSKPIDAARLRASVERWANVVARA